MVDGLGQVLVAAGSGTDLPLAGAGAGVEVGSLARLRLGLDRALASASVAHPHTRHAPGADPDDTVAGAARDPRPASGRPSVVRASRAGHQCSGTGPGRSGGAAR
ncbi:hypothetical protein FJK98_06425 [Micromonospora sp. HM134]|nr:hypothetical protein FJK98_06425 [Micromonospora sp. HM134]